ncbi:hypothetical protein FACS189419_07090 [Planctomycetales bacterium]|nr:hypothetical protein FACS189419_07090 [Planctomycetales bacterium]
MSLRTTIVNALLVCFYIGTAGNLQAQKVSILPEPVKLVMQSGTFRLDKDVEIVADKAIQQQSAFLAQIIQDKAKINLSVVEKAAQDKRIIRLEVTGRSGHPEGYTLQITPSAVLISAVAEAGIFYGIQSLRQLFPNDISAGIPCLEIEDEPQFAWRAFMLDVSRHFHRKEVVLKLLDNMAQLKMNVFHWHLVDSDGWRIEIKKYPELTKTGAFRDPYQRKGWGAVGYEYGIFDRKPAGGFYTQDEIREVVAYAAARNITIVPEIEMPGHADAAIGSYPWLGIPKEGTRKTLDNLIGTYVFDVTDPKVIEFFHDVLTEVMALFPSKVIHIGGDEVDYNSWKNSPAVSQYMKEKGIKTPADLQVDFTNKMSQWITSKGRRMMGWNEITGANIHGGKNDDHATEQRLAPGTVVQFWEGNPSLAKKAIEDGYDVVNSHNQFTYIDFTHKKISLERAYSFTPVPEGLTEEQKKRVLGLGCQLWTEFVPDEKAVNYRVYPRIAAYAETGWTAPDKKDYNRFLKALAYFLTEWEKQGIEYGQVQTVALDWGEKRWKDLPENPLIDPEIYGLPECVIGDPQILTPGKFDDKWHAFFHGFSHDKKGWRTWLFHSASEDGLHWTDISHKEGEIGIQYIFCDGDQWIQYYTADTRYMGDPEMKKKCSNLIRARTTTDFINWSNPVTLVTPDSPIEREGPRIQARNPCVIQLPDGRYRMYYSAGTVFLKDAGYEEPKNIFCAEADNPLGPFTKREEPVLVPDTNLPFRNYGCGGFKVFGYRNGYVAFYNPIYIDAEGKSRSEIRLLLSDDGLKWKEADCNPIVKPDSKIPWRSAIIYQLDVVHWEKSLLMYFNAREGWRGGAERIGAVKLDLNGEAPAVKLEKPFSKK